MRILASLSTLLVFASASARLTVGEERNTVLLKSPGNPLVSFRLVFHVGSSQDPPGKEGLAALTSLMLSQGGTEELSMTEVMEALYPMAAGVSAQPDKEVTTFIGRAHRDHLEPFFSNPFEALTTKSSASACKSRASIRRISSGTRISCSTSSPNPFEALTTKSSESNRSSGCGALHIVSCHAASCPACQAHPRCLGGGAAGQPRRHPVQGTVHGVESLTLDDVKAFYRERYTFENLQIGLGGDFPEGFPERVREDFKKALPSGATKAAVFPKVARGKGLDVTIVERDGADSTAISLGFPIDLTRSDDDFYPPPRTGNGASDVVPPNDIRSPWSTARPAEAATVPRKGHRPSRSS